MNHFKSHKVVKKNKYKINGKKKKNLINQSQNDIVGLMIVIRDNSCNVGTMSILELKD